MSCFRKSISVLISIVILISAFSLISFGYSDVTKVTTDAISAEAISQDINIMTFNLKVSGILSYSPESRLNGVVSTILKYMPDSVGMQEVDENWMKLLKSSKLMDYYDYVYLARNADGTGEGTPVFYLKDKYELLSTESFWLSKTPEKSSKGWDAGYLRVCSIAVLRDKQTGFVYAHFNTHLDVNGKTARCESVSLITKKMAQYNIPSVLTGDFNDNEDSDMYSRWAEAGLIDTKYVATSADEGDTYHGYGFNPGMLDYVWANGYMQSVSSYKIIKEQYDGVYPSDHFPLVVSLKLAFNPDSSFAAELIAAKAAADAKKAAEAEAAKASSAESTTTASATVSIPDTGSKIEINLCGFAVLATFGVCYLLIICRKKMTFENINTDK